MHLRSVCVANWSARWILAAALHPLCCFRIMSCDRATGSNSPLPQLLTRPPTFRILPFLAADNQRAPIYFGEAEALVCTCIYRNGKSLLLPVLSPYHRFSRLPVSCWHLRDGGPAWPVEARVLTGRPALLPHAVTEPTSAGASVQKVASNCIKLCSNERLTLKQQPINAKKWLQNRIAYKVT